MGVEARFMKSNLPSPAFETVTLVDLSERQAAFVREYVERGGRPGAAADAAVAAGYARPGPEGRAAARVRASELLRNEKVLRLLRDELARKLNAGAALGVQTLIDLAQNAKSEQVRLSAARELVDRGHAPIVSRNASIVAKTSVEDLLARLDGQEAAEQQRAIIDVNPIDRGIEAESESID
jgi:phage terminase small subunit